MLSLETPTLEMCAVPKSSIDLTFTGSACVILTLKYALPPSRSPTLALAPAHMYLL